jgi:hypothetical protein
MANIIKIKTRNRQKAVIQKKGSFNVRDLRDRAFFTVDNLFLDGKWMRLLKGCPASVYFALCRHANKEQVSFPSIPYLMDETGYGKLQIMRSIKTLEFHRLVGVHRQVGEHNMYSLINKKHWRKTIVVKQYILTDRKNL